MFNGLFTNSYNPLDSMFGLFMFFFFVVLFFAILAQIKINRDSLLKTSKQVAIYLAVPLIELFVYYIKYLISGNVPEGRLDISLGWGNRNTLGMLFVVLYPFILYLVKHGENRITNLSSLIFAAVLLGGIIITFSRQSYLFVFVLITGFLIYQFCTSKENEKKRNLIILCGWSGGLFVLGLAAFFAGFIGVFGSDSVDARFLLWIDATESVNRHPILGGGFFFIGYDPVVQLNSIMPYCCHNTLFEMLGACGLFGFGAYIVYRVLSVKKILNDLTIEKMYPFMACALIVLMSLLDIHLFDFFGSGLYVILLAMSMSKLSSKLSSKETQINSTEVQNEDQSINEKQNLNEEISK